MPAPATSPSSPPLGTSRERIDRAALALLARHGYAGFGMQALADIVGLHKSSLFHHYKSKTEIAQTAVRQTMEELANIADEHLALDVPDLNDFVAFAGEITDYFGEHPDAAKLLLRVVLAPTGHPLEALDAEHALYRLLTRLVRWFQAARTASVIRRVRIRHALFDLMGVVVFHPAAAPQMRYLAGETPFFAEEREKRRGEVTRLVHAALAP